MADRISLSKPITDRASLLFKQVTMGPLLNYIYFQIFTLPENKKKNTGFPDQPQTSSQFFWLHDQNRPSLISSIANSNSQSRIPRPEKPALVGLSNSLGQNLDHFARIDGRSDIPLETHRSYSNGDVSCVEIC